MPKGLKQEKLKTKRLFFSFHFSILFFGFIFFRLVKNISNGEFAEAGESEYYSNDLPPPRKEYVSRLHNYPCCIKIIIKKFLIAIKKASKGLASNHRYFYEKASKGLALNPARHGATRAPLATPLLFQIYYSLLECLCSHFRF